MNNISTVNLNAKKQSTLSLQKIAIIFLILFFFAMFFIRPERYANSVRQGLNAWVLVVLPSSLPFLFFCKLLAEFGLVEKLTINTQKISQKLYNVSGISAFIFIMSVMCGQPVGSKLLADFYDKKYLTSQECAKISSFCSISSPIFVLGGIGATVMSSYKIGAILLVTHILSALLNGLIYRGKKNIAISDKKYEFVYKSADTILKETITDTILSVMIVGSYIAIFFLITDILYDSYILYPIKKIFELFLSPYNLHSAGEGLALGIIEVTKGSLALGKINTNSALVTVLLSGLLGWSGISIHIQNITYLKIAGVKTSFYILTKITQAIISCVMTFFAVLIFL